MNQYRISKESINKESNPIGKIQFNGVFIDYSYQES